MPGLDERLKQVRHRIDNYSQTIAAIWALISILTWDNRAKRVRTERRFSVGRKMTQRRSGNDITPDVVVQFSDKLGIVAEAKRTLPKSDGHVREIIEQVRAYDEDLIGWWTTDEKIERHDVAVLVHQVHGVAFSNGLRSVEKQERSFRRAPCVVEFNVFEQVEQRMYLRISRGFTSRGGSVEGVDRGDTCSDGGCGRQLRGEIVL